MIDATITRAIVGLTHEAFIAQVRDIAATRLNDVERARVLGAKLTYGVGTPGVRGATYFGTWQNGHPTPSDLIEVCAVSEESPTQLAGTTLHELAHVLAGSMAGHSSTWRAACERLGLRRARGVAHRYSLAGFAPDIRARLAALFRMADGAPAFRGANESPRTPRPCGAGIGTRGGRSRGKGSGSRLRLWQCQCEPPIKLRVARDTLNVQCLDCGTMFARGDA